MAKRNDFTDDEFGAKLCRAYDSVAALHENGDRDDDAVHPREILNSWQREAREAREAAARAARRGRDHRSRRNRPAGTRERAARCRRRTAATPSASTIKPKFECADGVVYVGIKRLSCTPMQSTRARFAR